MNEGLLSKYPIDFSALRKGDEFSNQDLSVIVGKMPGTDEFRFAVMGLQGAIQDATSFTVKIISSGMRVLTDPEAAIHNHRLFEQNRRGMFSRLHLNTAVDSSALSDDQRSKHERNIVTESRYVSALLRTTKQIVCDARQHSPARLIEPEQATVSSSLDATSDLSRPRITLRPTRRSPLLARA